MTPARLATISLFALLLLVHGQLWLGSSGLRNTVALSTHLAAQQRDNEAARTRNERLRAEVNDLKEGLEMVEEKARFELGMIKPDEILVQVSKPH